MSLYRVGSTEDHRQVKLQRVVKKKVAVNKKKKNRGKIPKNEVRTSQNIT